MVDMTKKQLTQAQKDARHEDGKFGEVAKTDPAKGTLNSPVAPEDTTYVVCIDGKPAKNGVGKKGAGMSDALERAYVIMNHYDYTKTTAKPVFSIRCQDTGVTVQVPYGDQGQIVAEYGYGEAVTADEMDTESLSISSADKVFVDPYIDLGPYGEGELDEVCEWLREGYDRRLHISTVYARRDDETGGRHIDVDVNENLRFLADHLCPDDYEFTADPDSDLDAAAQRHEAWLDDNQDIIEDVYAEWFNAEITPSTDYGWEAASVAVRTTVPYGRFTSRLVLEDVHSNVAGYVNKTDAGTYGSPYVGNEILRRIREREAQQEEEAQFDRFEQQILAEGR